MKQPPLLDRLYVCYARAKHHPCHLRFLGVLRSLFRLRRVIVALPPSVRMELDPDDYLQREILFRGLYETRSMALFDRLLADARGCLDFGAHMGLYTLRAAAALAPRGGRVLAIEPTPAHSAALLRNAELSGLANIELCTAAFSRDPGLARMIAPHPANTGGSRLADGLHPDLRAIALHVPVRAAAELAPLLASGGADLIKIDVEGHEFHILASLLPALPELPRDILLECKPSEFDYGDLGAHLHWLHGLGYECRDIDGATWNGASSLPEDNLWLHRPAP